MSENQAVESSVSARTKDNPHGVIHRDKSNEVADRLRRMETKITCIMEKLGIATQAQKAELSHTGTRYVMNVPSLDIRLREVLENVPKGKVVSIYHKGGDVGAITC